MEELNKLDISKDNFSSYINNGQINVSDLLTYYLIKKDYADSLVLNDEYVGVTYDNLEKIEKVITKQLVVI